MVQVSRWDALKDHLGLLECFARHLERLAVHLALAGPAAPAVADDPEGAEVLERLIDAWRNLPEERRRRVHLVILPMDDLDENAAMVNALQRRADVVVQNSIAEGFRRAIRGLVDDPARAGRIGEAARRRVIDHFLGVYRLQDYVDLVARLVSGGE